MRPSSLPPAAATALVAAGLLFALPAFAETRSYQLSGFDKIDASAGVDVELRQGPFAVTAEERNGDFNKLILEVRGNTLHISRKTTNVFFGRAPDYRVVVTAPTYVALQASSGSDIEGAGLSLRDVRIEASSGSDVELSGSCVNLRISASSGSDFEGEHLKCETATVEASSGSDVDAHATRRASGEASSGADIVFHGNPADVARETSSGGSVRAR